MYERFTDRARKVMQLANEEAQRSHHEYIGTEHILLGLVQEGAGVAANVLKKLDIDLHKVRVEVERIVQPGPGVEQAVVGRLPHTPRVKRALDYSVEEARALNHNYVGTEHLLLGLLKEGEGVAAQVLMNLGLASATIREEILSVLGPTTDDGSGRSNPTDLAANAHKIPQTLEPGKVEVYTVSDLTPAELSTLPERLDNKDLTLTDEQIELIRDRIQKLDELKRAFVSDRDFAQARRCREEAIALTILLKLYRARS